MSLEELAIFTLPFLSSSVENGAHGGTLTKGDDGAATEEKQKEFLLPKKKEEEEEEEGEEEEKEAEEEEARWVTTPVIPALGRSEVQGHPRQPFLK